VGPIPVNGGRCFGRPRQHLGSLGDAFWNLFEQIKGLFGLLMGFGFWVENGGILGVFWVLGFLGPFLRLEGWGSPRGQYTRFSIDRGKLGVGTYPVPLVLRILVGFRPKKMLYGCIVVYIIQGKVYCQT